jgi:hypothetical protein
MSKKNDAMIELAYCDGFRAGYKNAYLCMSKCGYERKIAFAFEKLIKYRRDEALKIIKLEKYPNKKINK